MEFKDWLRQQIRARGLTEAQLEKITDENGEKVTQATINRILNGVTPNPRKNKVEALMRACGVDSRQLLTTPAPENERRLALVKQGNIDDDLKRLIDGYRLADPVTQKHMLRMAEDAIENFGKRSGEASL